MLAAGVGTGLVVVLGDGAPGPEREARRYLGAWARQDLEAMKAMATQPEGDFVAAHRAMNDALRVAKATFAPLAVERDGDRATSGFRATLTLRGLGDWGYDGRLELRRRDGRWLVAWAPATLHPDLSPGETFGRGRSRPERAPILDRAGQPLTQPGQVVSVGLEPRRVADRAAVAAALRDHAGVDPARVDAALDRPGLRPDVFVPLVDLREERFAPLRPVLAPVPGIVFRRKPARLTPSEGFARHVLGRTGEVTAEGLEKLGPLYQPGDVVGLSGIEAAFEQRLAGTPSGEVRLLDGSGTAVAVLHRFAGTAPAPVTVTLDRTLQGAAERALDGVTGPGAIVAVDSATGAVRAAVSRPVDEPFNRALAGRYPPGSTFKVVTTAALLSAGVTPDTSVACPAETVVDGKRFRNFEGEGRGDIAFSQAFFQSCNTAFVTQAARLPTDRLTAAAATFGFGADYDLGLRSAGGRFPPPSDDAEKAAAAIGQARVQASPLHMASVAAAVAGGTWRAPHLVAAPRRDAGPGARELAPDAAAALRSLMAGVVREGTGRAATVPGADVGGKTGTAEFGSGTPPATHAWFIGYRGPLGFAVLVEGGGVGGQVAAPLGGRFLAAAGAAAER